MLPSRLQSGDTAPAFELPDYDGTMRGLPLSGSGPASVIVFYRGHW